MELRTLRYFAAVAEELNITRAAEKLAMAQPPLSAQMRQLEEELGVTLFIRGKRRLTLTPEGEVMLQRTRQILELVQKTEAEVSSMESGLSGMLYISMVEGSAPGLVADWIAGFREEFPRVQYNLWNGSSDEVTDRLRKGLADVGVVLAPYDNMALEALPVASMPWVAMIPAGHPLAREQGKPLPLSALAGEPLILPARKSRVREIHSWFEGINATPQVLCEMSNFLDAYTLVQRSVGICIFPQTLRPGSSGEGVIYREISEPVHYARYVLGWARGRKLSPLAEQFVQYVSDTRQAELEQQARGQKEE